MGSSSNGSAELPRVGPDRSTLEKVLRAEVNPGARHRDRNVEPAGREVVERLAATGVLAEPDVPWRRWGRTLAWLGGTADELALPLALSLQQSRCTWYHDEEPLGRGMRDLQGLLPLAGTQAILEVDLGIAAAAQVRGVR